MKLTLNGEYKSLTSFVTEELPDLTVVTGKNGTGKSQLIELIKLKQSQNQFVNFNIEPNFHRIYVGELAVKTFNSVSNQNIKQLIDLQLQPIFSYGNGIFKLLDFLIKSNFFQNKNQTELLNDLRNSIEINDNISYAYNRQVPLPSRDGNGKVAYKNNLINTLINLPIKILDLISHVASGLNKSVEMLSMNDFQQAAIPVIFYDRNDIMDTEIGFAFYTYAKSRIRNELDYFKKTNRNAQNNSIPDDEFLNKYPPPWKLLNEIFEQYGFKYKFDELVFEEPNVEIVYQVMLRKTSSGIEITANDLSSGEKVILGLLLKVFNNNFYEQHLMFPDLLVLDEPDAFLHPEMTKLFIDVVINIFVKKFGIKVFFTTHSPSTIAISPNDCIYEMRNFPKTELAKIDKDEALKILTENIPTLSIDYSGQRQIFVEGLIDLNYYQTIYSLMRSSNKTTFNLYFIETGKGKSSNQQVSKITNELRQSGNKTCFGIIDWDLKNKSTSFLFVHGESRYTIENFIFDPIYLAIYFLEQNLANGIGELGFDKNFNQYLLPSTGDKKLQEIVDWFFKKMSEAFPTMDFNDKIEMEYGNGAKLFLPKCYLHENGHNLLYKLRKSFSSLENIADEEKFKNDLISIMAKCYPFISLDSINLLQNLYSK